VALNLDDKKAIVSELATVAASAHSAVGAEYRGLSVAQMTSLRRQARSSGVYLRVVKNNLAKRAIEGTDFECMQPELYGPLILAFSEEEPSSAARLVKNFAKDNAQLKVRMVSFGGQLMGANDLDRLASLPTREEALAQLLATMKAPLDKFARTVNEVPGKLVRTVAAIRDQKQAA
jgi:large subunit ribosomal protein L10